MSDEDNDSLEYYYEIAFGTDPNQFDSDGDSVGDGDEVIAYFNAQYLSPTIDNSEILIDLEKVFARNAYNMGEQSVLNNPSAYNLFTTEQYEEAMQSLDTNATPYTFWHGSTILNEGWMWTQKSTYPYFYDALVTGCTSNQVMKIHGSTTMESKEWMTLEDHADLTASPI